tara:strand:- start:2393 stop:2599 length:207 start_codon:yes stop_codon:yes gene_type:complete
MTYGPEQRMKIALHIEKQANTEKDDERRAILKEAARRRRIVANLGWKRAAEKMTTEILGRLQELASGK